MSRNSVCKKDQEYIRLMLVFARLYLSCRFMMFNSHLVRDSFSHSIGSLNQVSINFHFLLKTYIKQWPARCLLIFCILLFLISSWSLRACNYKHMTEHISMSDAMWLFVVTFTTVGMSDATIVDESDMFMSRLWRCHTGQLLRAK